MSFVAPALGLGRRKAPRPFCTVDGTPLPGAHRLREQPRTLARFLRQGPIGFFLDEAARHPDAEMLQFRIGPRRLIVPRSPEIIRRVLAPEDGEFERDSQPVETMFAHGLLAQRGAEWRRRRRLVSPPFRHRPMDAAVGTIVRATQDTIAAWRQGPPVFKPMPETSWLMLQVVGEVGFGFRFERERHASKALHRSLILLTRDTVLRAFSPVPAWLLVSSDRVRAARQHLLHLAEEIATHGLTRPAGADDLLARLLAAEADGTLEHEDVLGEIITFLVAGHETSSTALTWMLAVLAARPDLQQRCREEARTVLGGDAPTPRTLEQLPLLEQVIHETLRLYPPVPISNHRAARDLVVSGYQIPAGTQVNVISLLTHRDPTLWDDPMSFRPERFAPGTSRTRHPHQYLPFLAGKHVCVGKYLALLELKITAALLLQAFSFSAPDGPPVEDLRVSLHPKGFRLGIQPLAA